MSLKEQIKSRSAELVKREKVTLPELGIEVQVRGLMAGEVRRAGESKRSADVQIAISVEDPNTGQQIWNPNDLTDLDAIAGLHSVDMATLILASNRLSGMDRMEKLGKTISPPTDSGSSSSPNPSVEPSGS